MAAKLKDGLFLGDYEAAQDLEFIIANKITRIINCAAREIPNSWERSGVRYLSYRWPETGNCVIFDESNAVLDEIYSFIEEAIDRGESVLAHSVDGASRACFCSAVYFMLKYRWTLEKTLAYLQSKRPDLTPRPGFMRQLYALDQSLQRVTIGNLPKSDPRARRYSAWDVSAVPQNPDSDEALLVNTFVNSQPQTDSAIAAARPSVGGKPRKQRLTWIDDTSRKGGSHSQVPISPFTRRPVAERPPTPSYSDLEPGGGWIDTLDRTRRSKSTAPSDGRPKQIVGILKTAASKQNRSKSASGRSESNPIEDGTPSRRPPSPRQSSIRHSSSERAIDKSSTPTGGASQTPNGSSTNLRRTHSLTEDIVHNPSTGSLPSPSASGQTSLRPLKRTDAWGQSAAAPQSTSVQTSTARPSGRPSSARSEASDGGVTLDDLASRAEVQHEPSSDRPRALPPARPTSAPAGGHGASFNGTASNGAGSSAASYYQNSLTVGRSSMNSSLQRLSTRASAQNFNRPSSGSGPVRAIQPARPSSAQQQPARYVQRVDLASTWSPAAGSMRNFRPAPMREPSPSRQQAPASSSGSGSSGSRSRKHAYAKRGVTPPKRVQQPQSSAPPSSAGLRSRGRQRERSTNQPLSQSLSAADFLAARRAGSPSMGNTRQRSSGSGVRSSTPQPRRGTSGGWGSTPSGGLSGSFGRPSSATVGAVGGSGYGTPSSQRVPRRASSARRSGSSHRPKWSL